ncbi:chloride channel CLIC-like protein 1 isoform X1 [Hylaeus anthracinus]|uniref:chloride channel CLIC-like protein 1 isoform X1 n=1 Tax=Hylaeus anthracinus TaxID=313031 RepID=UPI0023B9765A|nr:chloride channel CLIC-like protein 1 isoform X1 [Hylaeus anthracinus]
MKCSYGLIYIIINVSITILMVQCEDENYFEDIRNPDQIVDPHSFYYDRQSKKMLTETDPEVVESSVEINNEVEKELKYCKQINNFSSHEAIFYKRLINLLLLNINIKAKDDISVVGILEIEISHLQMEILQNLDTQKTSLRELDEIMSNIIRKPLYNDMIDFMHVLDVLIDKFEMALKVIQTHPDGAIIVFGMLMIFLTFRMIKRGHGFSMFIILQIIFVSSFFMTWWQLIQEAEIKSTAEQMKFASIPISCQPDKMSMWDKFVSFITSNDDCEKYYQVTMSNPKLKITPAFVLSHFITTVVLHPFTHVGTVVSDFINNATADLPWTYAWIIKCILYLCVGTTIIALPFCLSGTSINLGLGPLFKIGLGHPKKDRKGNSLQDVQKRDRLEIILQVPHGTRVPAIQGASEIKESNEAQILDNDSHELREDSSCGDTITNTKRSKSDNKKLECEQINSDELKKNNGSGDN